jgi:redox-sensing transcriptional repressor
MPGKTAISDMVISRLPHYLQALRHMASQGCRVILSQELGAHLGISAPQIRKDLSLFGEFGKQGTGYDIANLIGQLNQILNTNSIWDMVIVGAGNIGRAIASYQDFTDRGFRVAMIYDNDPQKIGSRVGNYIIQDIKDMAAAIKAKRIKIAVLAVPAVEAQEVTNQLVKADIKAILNYAPIAITVPADVHVQHLDPVVYLQQMTYYLET